MGGLAPPRRSRADQRRADDRVPRVDARQPVVPDRRADPGDRRGLLVAAVPAVQSRSDGKAFLVGAGAVLLLVVVLFAALYPNALPSSTNHAFDLSLAAASSSHYTLTVMTVVAIIFVPIVLGYTAWTYWVFRQRLGRSDFDGSLTPVSLLEHKFPSKNGASGSAQTPTDAPAPS